MNKEKFVNQEEISVINDAPNEEQIMTKEEAKEVTLEKGDDIGYKDLTPSLQLMEYEAFLFICQGIQKDGIEQLDNELNKINKYRRENTCNRATTIKLRQDVLLIDKERKNCNTKLKMIETSLSTLQDFKKLNNYNYELSQEFITNESIKYLTKDKEKEIKDGQKE